MSKVGKKPISIPSGVNVEIKENIVTVKGPKGTLNYEFNPMMDVKVEKNQIWVKRPNDEKIFCSLHGTVRQIINNMVIGVTQGYKKTLIVEGTGYKASMQGNKLILNVGYSHPVEYTPPEGITIKVEGNNKIIVEGIDKQKVGQVAAELRKVREPDSYKGKGLRYEDERIKLKPGKAAAGKGAA